MLFGRQAEQLITPMQAMVRTTRLMALYLDIPVRKNHPITELCAEIDRKLAALMREVA